MLASCKLPQHFALQLICFQEERRLPYLILISIFRAFIWPQLLEYFWGNKPVMAWLYLSKNCPSYNIDSLGLVSKTVNHCNIFSQCGRGSSEERKGDSQLLLVMKAMREVKAAAILPSPPFKRYEWSEDSAGTNCCWIVWRCGIVQCLVFYYS